MLKNLTPDERKPFLDYCKSNIELQVMSAFSTGLNYREIAAELNLSYAQVTNAVTRVKARAALAGYAPEHSMTKTAPDTHYVKGVSTLYDRKGEIAMQWVKTDRRAEQLTERLRELAEALKEELPQVAALPAPEIDYERDLMAVYPIGDSHIGLFSWKEETGDNFDLKIAERNLCGVVDRLVDTAPPCERALIINLGDFFHADNLESRTMRSGHALDTDTRWAKVLRVGVKALRRCIESALRKHQKVTVINAIGNHDDHTSMMLSVMLSHVYENEERVEILDAPSAKHYVRFGKNLIGVTHGHTMKLDELPLQMATDRAEDWGDTEHRVWYVGHFHHQNVREIQGVVVEVFRTLAAKDAWHAAHGYKAGRDMNAILLHREYGEVERHRVSLKMMGFTG